MARPALPTRCRQLCQAMSARSRRSARRQDRQRIDVPPFCRHATGRPRAAAASPGSVGAGRPPAGDGRAARVPAELPAGHGDRARQAEPHQLPRLRLPYSATSDEHASVTGNRRSRGLNGPTSAGRYYADSAGIRVMRLRICSETARVLLLLGSREEGRWTIRA
jgi:hypothetical protein